MSPRRILPVLAVALLPLLAAGCSSDLAAPEEGFTGSWQWVVSEGGIAGQQYDPHSAGFTVTLEYGLDGRVRAYRDDTLVATARYTAQERLSITANGIPEWEITYDPPLRDVFEFDTLDEHVVQFVSKSVVHFIEPCCDRYVHVFTDPYVR